MSSIIYLVIGAGATIVLVWLWRFKKDGQPGQSVLLNQRLDGMVAAVNQSLRDTIKLVSEQLEQNRQSAERASQTVHKQVEGFTTGLTRLTENLKQVHESVKDVSSFQDIFKSPKLRGIWGEASLEASLGQYFSKDSYTLQHYFSSGEAVDAVLKLPNGLLLPIDSKFNWENFEKMVNADNDLAREQHKKTFFSDVKKKIDEIAAKYILPSESTTDFALMYVPAETVYYEVINNIKEADVPAYARNKKVFLVSPNTFGLSISAIMHWLKDVQLSRQTKEIMKRLERIAVDGRKLGDDFRKLGNYISNAQGAFESSDKRLGLMLDRVENVIEVGEKEIPDSLPPAA
ncbi:MAG: DNA recombination protein RmuC [Patescibacteria group bacterium]